MQYFNKTRYFMKYCYLTTKYVKNDACLCKDACKMAIYCDLTKRKRTFDDCNCVHNCKAVKNEMQHYFDHYKKN